MAAVTAAVVGLIAALIAVVCPSPSSSQHAQSASRPSPDSASFGTGTAPPSGAPSHAGPGAPLDVAFIQVASSLLSELGSALLKAASILRARHLTPPRASRANLDPNTPAFSSASASSARGKAKTRVTSPVPSTRTSTPVGERAPSSQRPSPPAASAQAPPRPKRDRTGAGCAERRREARCAKLQRRHQQPAQQSQAPGQQQQPEPPQQQHQGSGQQPEQQASEQGQSHAEGSQGELPHVHLTRALVAGQAEPEFVASQPNSAHAMPATQCGAETTERALILPPQEQIAAAAALSPAEDEASEGCAAAASEQLQSMPPLPVLLSGGEADASHMLHTGHQAEHGLVGPCAVTLALSAPVARPEDLPAMQPSSSAADHLQLVAASEIPRAGIKRKRHVLAAAQ